MPMSGPIRKMVVGASLFLAICITAVAGYMAHGWRLDDSIYMVVITIFGVGYGEVQPVESPALRALTIMVIIAGYGAVIYTVGGFMQMVVDGELQKALGARRMSLEIDRLDRHTIICGVGRMGSILARELAASGKPFVVIDTDERRLHAAQELGYLFINGDATDEHVLEQAGIKKAAVLATVLSEDTTNVFVAVTARGMNAEIMIIARGENPKTEKKLLGCGANKVVLPTAIGAKKLAQMIIRPSAEHMLEQMTAQGDMKDELGRIGLQFDELTVVDGAALIGKTISSIELRSNHGFLIVGVRKPDGSTVLNPPGETILESGDTVIVLGHTNDIPQLAERFNAKSRKITYRGVTLDS
ncbi:potassium channel protein [Bremerella cremea]|uniref:Potassium channel protein n=2 Tax=Pirellulales TaxID=2691354 RepID=A0A2S8G674_9BACT|nr:potassium channel protein [Blastopirellula marina]RCS51419.1 potassium channel protein [Bremerella cremea]